MARAMRDVHAAVLHRGRRDRGQHCAALNRRGLRRRGSLPDVGRGRLHITGGGLLMLGGRLGDLLGRRRTLLVGTTLFGAASLLAGLAPSFPVLVAARLLQGAGEAIALPAAMATIVLLFPEGPRRSRALSVWAAVASCGLVLGFALSGIITAHLGWRWIFLISVPFILVVIVA